MWWWGGTCHTLSCSFGDTFSPSLGVTHCPLYGAICSLAHGCTAWSYCMAVTAGPLDRFLQLRKACIDTRHCFMYEVRLQPASSLHAPHALCVWGGCWRVGCDFVSCICIFLKRLQRLAECAKTHRNPGRSAKGLGRSCFFSSYKNTVGACVPGSGCTVLGGKGLGGYVGRAQLCLETSDEASKSATIGTVNR